MADYVTTFFKLLLTIFVLLQLSLAPEGQEAVCGFPGAPAFGYVRPDQDTYDDDDVVKFSCRGGYILLGAPISRCTSDGSWTEQVPVCDESMTVRGIASSTPTLPGHSAEMAIDKDRETCTYLKEKKPRWWRIDLGNSYKILSVALSVVTTDKYVKFTVYVIEIKGTSASYKRCGSFSGKFGSQTILLSCAEDKGLEGQRVHIEDYHQEGFFEICEVEVQVEKETGFHCGRPDRRPLSMTYEEDDGEVEYHCKTGYKLVGDAERQCETSTGQWSGEAPFCKPIVCDSLPDIENGELTYAVEDGDIPLEGSTAIYKCDYGYMIEGDITRLCLKDGSWSGKQPVCKAGGATMAMKDPPRIVNREGVIFGMAVAAIMMLIILVSFFVVKRRRDANKPELPSRQNEPVVPPPRPPPRAKGLKSALMDLVNRDSAASKYESLNLEDGEGAGWKTRSLPLENGSNEVIRDDLGSNKRTLSYDDPEKLTPRDRGAEAEKSVPEAEKGRVITPVGDYAAVDYDKKRQSRLLKEQDSEERSPGTSPAGGGEQLRELPPIPKEEEEEESRALSPGTARSPSTDKEKDQDEEKSEESEDVSLPIAPSETSEAPTPSPDVVIENQVEGPSASPTTPPPEITPGRRRRRGAPEQPSAEEAAESRRTQSRGEQPTPENAAPTGRRRSRAAEQPSVEDAPSPTGRTRTRRRTIEPEEPESPPPPPPVEEERPARRTRGAGRFDTPTSTTSQPSSRRRY